MFAKRTQTRRPKRIAKVIVLLLLMFPILIGMSALVMDGSDLLSKHRRLQQAADSAALAAATEALFDGSKLQMIQAGEQFALTRSGFQDLSIQITTPPNQGKHLGQEGYLHARLAVPHKSIFSHLLDGILARNIVAHSTVRLKKSAHQAAIVALDPSPELLSITGLPTGIGTSTSLAGVEVEGLGGLTVRGAVHNNNEFGGFDELGRRVGDPHLIRRSMICLPGLGLTQVRANEIRVVGGVDFPGNYGAVTGNKTSLKANRLPVPDPFASMPVPIAGIHEGTSVQNKGGALIIGLPLLTPPVTLTPGIYDWIQVTSGAVVFEPGIYIIRSKNPITQASLAFLAGDVRAEGVMFYIQTSANPALDDGSEPPYEIAPIFPSVIIANGLFGSELEGLQNPSSPFHGMLVYQQRGDRRPMVIIAQNLLGTSKIAGAIYSKWGHVIVAGQGKFGLTLVAGSIRFVAVGLIDITPKYPAQAATDVQLVD